MADPQLVDNHTYPSYYPAFLTLTKHTSDEYMRRHFRYLSKVLKPDSVIFLGDYQDNGRSTTDEYYEKELVRFHRIFQNYNLVENFVTNLPGNHDIGWKNGIKKHSLERFEKSYGVAKPYEIFNTQFIPLNTLALANTEDESIYGPPRKILQQIAEEDINKPKVLLTHVPLYRDKSESCGPLREADSFPYIAGYQYQSVLDPDVSKEILTKIKPNLIFSGDDHDYCFVKHHLPNDKSVAEFTVKSISMTMGVHYPAVQLLTIVDQNKPDQAFNKDNLKLSTTICYLPEPYRDIAAYATTAVVTGLVIIINAFCTVRVKSYSKNNEDSLINRLLSYFQKKKVSPYAPLNNSVPMESFRISIDDEYDEPIRNYRRKVRPKPGALFQSSKSDYKNHIITVSSVIFFEFLIMAFISIALYRLFLW